MTKPGVEPTTFYAHGKCSTSRPPGLELQKLIVTAYIGKNAEKDIFNAYLLKLILDPKWQMNLKLTVNCQIGLVLSLLNSSQFVLAKSNEN